MRTHLIRSTLSITTIAIFSVIMGCKSNPTTPPTPPPPADTTALRLSSTDRDTIFTSPASFFTIALLVRKDTIGVDSAYIDVYDPILKLQKHLGPTNASGFYSFADTLPQQDIPLKLYTIKFYASKGTQKDSIVRYVNVGTHPLPLVLTVPIPLAETTYVKHNASISFKFHIEHQGMPIDSSFIDFLDPLQSATPMNVHLGGTAGFTGNLTWTDIIGNDVPSGPYPITFYASHRNMLADSAVRVIWVVGSDSEQMSVRANSISSTSIGVTWQRLTKDKGTDTVVAVSNGVVAAIAMAAGPSNATAILTGLTQGTVYSISVHATTAFSESILWATSLRYGPVRIYDNAHQDASHPSGLVLGTQGTEVVTSTGSVPQSDLMLSSDPASGSTLSLNSVSASDLSHRTDGKITQFGAYLIAGSLDGISFHQDLSTRFVDTTYNVYQIPPGQQSNIIFPIHTADNHYALVELLTQSDGTLFGTTGGASFVDLMVSYQPTAGLPYASRARHTRGSESERVGRLQR